VTDFMRAAATVPTAIGLAVVAVGVVRALAAPRHAAGSLARALALALEFFLAAGLLRLAALQDLESLGLAAFIIALRRLISYGLRFGVRAADGTA
jgi:uncharacterized membrane protein